MRRWSTGTSRSRSGPGSPGEGPQVSRDEADDGGRRAARRRGPLDRAGARLHRAGRRPSAPRRCSWSTGRAGSRPTPTASPPCSRPIVDKLLREEGRADRAVPRPSARGSPAPRSALLLGFLAGKVLGQFDPFHDAGRPAAAGGAQHRPRRARARRRPHRLPALGLPARGDPPGAVHRRAVDARPPASPRSSAIAETDRARASSSTTASDGSSEAFARRRQPARRHRHARSRRRSSTGSPGSCRCSRATPTWSWTASAPP